MKRRSDPKTVEAWCHEDGAEYLLGKDATQLDRHWNALNGYGGKVIGRAADMSGLSAVDMALWDLYAQRAGVPLYEALGGLKSSLQSASTTPAPDTHTALTASAGSLWATSTIALSTNTKTNTHFSPTPAHLPMTFLSEGYTAMKIWPFDQVAEKSNGQFISGPDLEMCTEPFRLIREKVGNKIDVMLEMHSTYNLPSAIRIAKNVEPYDPFWFEDPVPMDNIDALVAFRNSTHIAVTASETVATRWAFREMFEKQAMTICMFDISWVGGISEAKRSHRNG